MTKPNSLCVLRLSALGDCINAFGLIGGLKRTYPQLKLTWVLDQRFASLFCDEQGHDLVPMLRVDFKNQGLSAAWQLKKRLKELQKEDESTYCFDTLLNMQTSIKSSLCSLMIKAPHKYGYDDERSREGQKFFVNHQISSPDNPHVMAGFMAFAEACGLPIAEPYWDFKLDPYIIDKAKCLVNHEKVFALCPCSAKEAKNWTLDGYVEIAKYAQNKGMCVVLLGGNNHIEQSMCQAISEQCPNVVNLCGKTNLRELAAMLSISKLALAPDSGSMHLASALGTPVVGLFAIHDDHRVGPWNFMDLNVSVYHKLASKELKGKEIPWRYRVRSEGAMANITTDQVINSIERAFDQYRI